MDTHLLINTSGILTSPYYPSFYLNNMSRRWHLEASNSQRIHIAFLYLDIEQYPTCKNDYVMIQDGRSSEKQSYFCGKSIPAEFKSSSNQLLIVFKSNNKTAGTGFKIRYMIVKENEDDGCLLADVPNCPENCRCYRWPLDQSKISVYARDLNNIASVYPQYTSAISLMENFITVIERGAFRKLRSLKTFRLSQNTITSIPRNIFSENPSLEVVGSAVQATWDCKHGYQESKQKEIKSIGSPGKRQGTTCSMWACKTAKLRATIRSDQLHCKQSEERLQMLQEKIEADDDEN
ncbi:G- coupled receptor GRL101 [Paramuricea clavata]|uniref:G- coupled receptor GRL101 n=1 Tax=Paramuricea clavata TaxID=317549 RepID=A0A7D9JPX6_PARCT|nr:G- coupled receptor GRL101 [Paramuricea clavata]